MLLQSLQYLHCKSLHYYLLLLQVARLPLGDMRLLILKPVDFTHYQNTGNGNAMSALLHHVTQAFRYLKNVGRGSDNIYVGTIWEDARNGTHPCNHHQNRLEMRWVPPWQVHLLAEGVHKKRRNYSTANISMNATSATPVATWYSVIIAPSHFIHNVTFLHLPKSRPLTNIGNAVNVVLQNWYEDTSVENAMHVYDKSVNAVGIVVIWSSLGDMVY